MDAGENKCLSNGTISTLESDDGKNIVESSEDSGDEHTAYWHPGKLSVPIKEKGNQSHGKHDNESAHNRRMSFTRTAVDAECRVVLAVFSPNFEMIEKRQDKRRESEAYDESEQPETYGMRNFGNLLW